MICKICNNNNTSLKQHCKDYSLTQEPFDIWVCNTCNFLYTYPAPSKDQIAPYYHFPEYISHSDVNKGWMFKLYHKVRNRTLEQKVKWIQSLFTGYKGNLLEIGAGTGAFASAMFKKGWEVTALEPDAGSREKALLNYDITLHPIDTLQHLPNHKFDVITLWHVLEHVHDLTEYLQIFKRLLKPNGRLIIAVPNNDSFDANYYKSFWAAYDVPRHLYHFTPHSMNLLSLKFGFKIVQYKPMWYDSFYVSLLSEKYKKSGILGTMRAFIIGCFSNLKALKNPKKASSIIYEIKIGE